MKIESESQWGHNIERFQAAVGLIQRALDVISCNSNEKLYRSLYRHNDQLLNVIAGLQRIGVTIVVKNGRKSKRNMMSEI